MKLTKRQALNQGFELCLPVGETEAQLIKDMKRDELLQDDIFILNIEPDYEENGQHFYPSTGILLVAEEMNV